MITALDQHHGYRIPWLWSDTEFTWEALAQAIAWLSASLHLLLCVKLLEYGSIHEGFGPFVAIVYQMLMDMAQFFAVWVLFLICFTNALWLVFKNSAHGMTYPESLLLLFRWMLEQGGYDLFADFPSHYQTVGRTLYLVYLVVCVLLLINMLIAMMGNSFGKVTAQKTEEWLLRYTDQMLKCRESARFFGGFWCGKDHYEVYLRKVTEDNLKQVVLPPFDNDLVRPISEEEEHRTVVTRLLADIQDQIQSLYHHVDFIKFWVLGFGVGCVAVYFSGWTND
jgi:hypothetical protein